MYTYVCFLILPLIFLIILHYISYCKAHLHYISTIYVYICIQSILVICCVAIFVVDLEVFFDPSQYTVREGENQLIFLRANKEYEIPFSVNVTLTDITTLGTYKL